MGIAENDEVKLFHPKLNIQYHTSGLLPSLGHGNASHFHFFKAVASSRQNTAPLLQHVTQINKQKLSSLEHGPQMPQEEQIQTLS